MTKPPTDRWSKQAGRVGQDEGQYGQYRVRQHVRGSKNSVSCGRGADPDIGNVGVRKNIRGTKMSRPTAGTPGRYRATPNLQTHGDSVLA